MEKWTVEEFACLQERLIELDMGYKVIRISPFEFSIIKEKDGWIEPVADYNSFTQEIGSYK